MDKGLEVRENWVCWGHPKKSDTASGSSEGGQSGEVEAGKAAGPDREGTMSRLWGACMESFFLVEKR